MKGKLISVAVLFMLLVSFTVAFAEDEEFIYPSKDPVFSITIPDGWKSELDENMLHAGPADDSIYLGLWVLQEDDSLEAALDALDESIAGYVRDLKTGEPEEVVINDIKFMTVDGTATDKDGDPVNVSVALFSPDDETIFILIYFGSDEAEKKHDSELSAVLNSIKAVNSDEEENDNEDEEEE